MPRFEIISPDRSTSAQLVGANAADILNIVHRLGLKEAEVKRDGKYSFSVRLDSNGPWCVYQRDEGGHPDASKALG